MNSYEKWELLAMPTRKVYKDMTDSELEKLLLTSKNYNILIPTLIEVNIRKNAEIEELTKRIAALENKSLKKSGRKRISYYLDGKELTDEDIIYYIDGDYYSFPELERTVGAKKNQLRNRYIRAKPKSGQYNNQI